MPTPKKPTKLLKLLGNPGGRPLNKNEPEPEEAIPAKPRNLFTKEASAEWDRIVPELEACGLLSNLDYAALIGYCVAFGHIIKCEHMLKQYGLTIETPNGMVQSSPYITQRNQALQIMHKYLVGFGLDPSSRTKISVEKKQKSEDPLKKYSK